MDKDAEAVGWTVEGMLDEIERLERTMVDRSLAFILGAGASIPSGIPGGAALTEQWLRDLHRQECRDGSAVERWVCENNLGIAGVTFADRGRFYPHIFERRFRGDPESGYAALEAEMEGKEPSLGYSLLAEILEKTRHKVVVTTNFDNLVADALAIHAHHHPLVVGHESLAGFVRPRLRRPLVAKIHRDLLLPPKNDRDGVDVLEQGWTEALYRLFQHYTPVVVGYGGNDGSLMGFLERLPAGHIPGRLFWCYREGSLPDEHIRNVVAQHRGKIVPIAGFDEFMLRLAEKLVPNLDLAEIWKRITSLGQRRADEYRQRAEHLASSVAKAQLGSKEGSTESNTLAAALKNDTSWLTWELRAQAEADVSKRDGIYKRALTQLPDSIELMINYATFLRGYRKSAEHAERLFRNAVEISPDSILALLGYANCIARENVGQAEEIYKKVLKLEPNNVSALDAYATLLAYSRKDYDRADELYRTALTLDPTNVFSNANLSGFLVSRSKFKEAHRFADRALNIMTTDSAQQSTAEALFYLALIQTILFKSCDQTLARIKSLLLQDFHRHDWDWDFSPMMDAAFAEVPSTEHDLFRALAAAILDPSKVPAMDAFPRWRALKPSPVR